MGEGEYDFFVLRRMAGQIVATARSGKVWYGGVAVVLGGCGKAGAGHVEARLAAVMADRHGACARRACWRGRRTRVGWAGLPGKQEGVHVRGGGDLDGDRAESGARGWSSALPPGRIWWSSRRMASTARRVTAGPQDRREATAALRELPVPWSAARHGGADADRSGVARVALILCGALGSAEIPLRLREAALRAMRGRMGAESGGHADDIAMVSAIPG
jgi:hypothetical protein